ncbi:hypothetical protein D7V93_23605 [Corallococcus llansteffanensis]|uniref:Transposase n=1 Tax=Corallococcus llansteffanensis TaxID=2316731 RepID=A0A3A8PGN1_9BACT|nr:hypothetical protein D7V93_23605 [Corallococcus llansteffanensis]
MDTGDEVTERAQEVHAGVQSPRVKQVLEEGKSRAQVATDLHLTRSALGTWVRQARADAGQGPSGVLTTGEKEELVHLRPNPSPHQRKDAGGAHWGHMRNRAQKKSPATP